MHQIKKIIIYIFLLLMQVGLMGQEDCYINEKYLATIIPLKKDKFFLSPVKYGAHRIFLSKEDAIIESEILSEEILKTVFKKDIDEFFKIFFPRLKGKNYIKMVKKEKDKYRFFELFSSNYPLQRSIKKNNYYVIITPVEAGTLKIEYDPVFKIVLYDGENLCVPIERLEKGFLFFYVVRRSKGKYELLFYGYDNREEGKLYLYTVHKIE